MRSLCTARLAATGAWAAGNGLIARPLFIEVMLVHILMTSSSGTSLLDKVGFPLHRTDLDCRPEGARSIARTVADLSEAT
jgi:hypothetical protein